MWYWVCSVLEGEVGSEKEGELGGKGGEGGRGKAGCGRRVGRERARPGAAVGKVDVMPKVNLCYAMLWWHAGGGR